ncbi:MAG: hypothetical protein ACLRPT_05905 [Akkermansia muciniphila]
MNSLLHAALSAGEEWGHAVEAGKARYRESVLRIRSAWCLAWLAEARFLWLAGLFAVARAASRGAASDLPPVLARVGRP